MIETRIVLEFLKDHPDRVQEWAKADSGSARRAFSFESLYQQVDNADFWKNWWDQLNGVVHSNRTGAPPLSRTRPVMGIDMYWGPFYDPHIQARLFLEVLALCQWHCGLLSRSYRQYLPESWEKRADSIASAYYAYASPLLERAEDEWKRVRMEPGTISLVEQRRGAKALGWSADWAQPFEDKHPFDLPILPP